MVRRNGNIPNKGSSSKPKNYYLFYKCGKPGHFIKDCPALKQEHFKHNSDKAAKRNPIPDKCFKRKNAADNVVKQALVAWGDSSSECEEEDDAGDNSMMVVESEANDLVNDKDALTLELGNAEQTRDDLVVCVVDLKETIGNLENEKEVLTERITSVEQERDDLMVVVVDLKETIENSSKENDALVEKVAGIRFQRERTPYNPHSKYVTVPDNWLCTYCGNNGHFKENCQARVQSLQKNKVFVERVTAERGPALQGGSVYVGNGKKGYILGVGKIGKSPTYSIENVCYANGLKYSLLSVSQICDKGNRVEFLSKICTVTNLVTGEVVLKAKRYKNIYIADLESLQSGDLSCLKVVDDDFELWHRRLGHARFSLLNKLVQKDLVRGLPKSKFNEHKVSDTCARGKHVKSSFKPKKDVEPQNHLIFFIWIYVVL
uniref:CCHC-type domain-containing protein n=2 Tax=Nicotiana TaxID=4085 RepID=A0A1S3Z243_TOBAC|nr:PREDICTED: uncharacterized protein LOC104211841 [Nicotiana sylvestris]XP_016458232.1 PREDICTED: uncharacterized protein LOC107781927 [Nicotiana tabacum]